ncbi:MAG: AEC family transporter [Eubacteriales bacterium]|nr:AEC family transporter [Eubacteriales bacterium]
MLIVEKLLVFLILMLTGLFLTRVRILDEPTCRKLSALVVNVANPAMIIKSTLAENVITGSELVTTALISAGMFAMLIAVGIWLPKLLRAERSETNAYTLMTVFSNIGFMGLPLISAIYGDSALLYVTVFIIPFNILIYTYGIALMRGPEPAAERSSLLGKILNPGVVASAVALAIYLLHIPIPDVIAAPVGYLSDLTAPLSMMVIGASLAGVKLREFFTDVRLFAFSIVKLLVMPIVLCFLLKLLIGEGVLLGVCIVMAGAPVASMTVMMAQEYEGDYTLTSKGVALTTILSVVTIPAVFAVLL